MKLPKLDVPVYDLTLTSNNQKVRYRPFRVREEKLLLMALEANNEDDTRKAIRQIINNCVIDEVDVDELPLFDIEYFFLQLRARSKGEVIAPKYKCRNPLTVEGETKECG